MTQQLRFDGATVQEAIVKANKICGSGAKVVFAQRIKSKRGFGLWTKMKYEIVVEPDLTSHAGEVVDTKTFADELRAAISSEVYVNSSSAQERFRVRPNAGSLRKYRRYSEEALQEESASTIEEKLGALEPQEILEEPSQLGPMIYRRNGSRGYLENYEKPTWAVRATDIEEFTLDCSNEQSGSLCEPWRSTIESRVGASIIDLTNGRVAQSVPLDIDDKDDAVDEEVVNHVIALRSLHELPYVCDGTLVLLTSCGDGNAHRSVSEVGRRFNVREDRRVFLQGPFDSTMPEDPKEILSSLKIGESVLVMASRSAVSEFKKVFPEDRLMVVVEIDACQTLSSAMSQLAALGKVDAISVVNAHASPAPHGIVSLGLPIVALNGRTSSVSQWLNLLLSRRDGLVR